MSKRLNYAGCRLEGSACMSGLTDALESHGFEIKPDPMVELLRLHEVQSIRPDVAAERFNTDLAQKIEEIDLSSLYVGVKSARIFTMSRKRQIAALNLIVTSEYQAAREVLVGCAEESMRPQELPEIFDMHRWSLPIAKLRDKSKIDRTTLYEQMNSVCPTRVALGRLSVIE